MKKLIALLCMAAVMVGLFAGCAPESHVGADGIVTMDWYYPGGAKSEDAEMVEAKLNEYIGEKIGLNLNFVGMTNNDYTTSVPTILRAGQSAGIVTIYGMDYYQLCKEGALYPMTDLLEQYGTGTKKLFKDVVWKGLETDGEIYMVPTFKDNANVMGYIYNKTMADDLGIDMSEYDVKISTLDDEEFLMDVLEKRNEKYPEDAGTPLLNNATSLEYFINLVNFGQNAFISANYKNNPAVAGYDDKTVFNFYATEEYRQLCLKRQRLCEAGVIAWDYAAGGYGTSTSFIVPSWGYVVISDHQYSKNWESVLVRFDTVWGSIANYTVAGTAIPANCPDPEKAMQFIELLNTDPYIGTLMHFGIQDVHWKLQDGKVVTEGTRNDEDSEGGWRNWYGMGFGAVTNLEHAPEEDVGKEGYLLQELTKANEEADMPTYIGFVFDPEPVANEIAACNNVVHEYNTELIAGHYDSAEDVDMALQMFNDKLIANGVERIVAECQRQMDAWAAANS